MLLNQLGPVIYTNVLMYTIPAKYDAQDQGDQKD